MATGFVILSYCVLILSSNRTNMVHDLRTGSYEFLVINNISNCVTALSNTKWSAKQQATTTQSLFSFNM